MVRPFRCLSGASTLCAGKHCHMLDDAPHEACGLIGIYTESTADLGRLCFFGLFTLQHRGQESAGIAVTDGRVVSCHKEMGLVNQVFDEETVSRLPGRIGIGHTRYSTTGSTTLRNAQPILGDFHGMPFALGHNGNLINAEAVRDELVGRGASMDSTSDSELIVKLIEQSSSADFDTALREALHRVEGAYSLVIMTPEKLIGLRDPWGIRPLCMGRSASGDVVIASETCALGLLQARFIREIEPGEMVSVIDGEIHAERSEDSQAEALCAFEFIYFARPDSRMYGRTLYESRRSMGHLLAESDTVQADLVIGIPDTGVPGAIGYAEAKRMPFAQGLVKNRYIQRTFIQPDPHMRELGVRMKLAALNDVLAGKRLIVVDDSIVRGTTTVQQVQLLREAGAAEVHLRICAPPIRFPCFYGIDMADQNELVASANSVEKIRERLGADSLVYQTIPDLVRAVGVPRRKLCLACFDGRYPLSIPEHIRVRKFALEEASQDD
jgi:amidophosphoribosyltransferase